MIKRYLYIKGPSGYTRLDLSLILQVFKEDNKITIKKIGGEKIIMISNNLEQTNKNYELIYEADMEYTSSLEKEKDD